METTATLFVEIPDLELHYDPMYDSLYIVGSCHFRLYLFSNRDFVAPLFHPTFDLAAPYFAIPLRVVNPVPPPAPAGPAALLPVSPLQAVSDFSLDPERDPSEASSSSSSSSGSAAGYSPARPSMANGYMIE